MAGPNAAVADVFDDGRSCSPRCASTASRGSSRSAATASITPAPYLGEGEEPGLLAPGQGASRDGTLPRAPPVAGRSRPRCDRLAPLAVRSFSRDHRGITARAFPASLSRMSKALRALFSCKEAETPHAAGFAALPACIALRPIGVRTIPANGRFRAGARHILGHGNAYTSHAWGRKLSARSAFPAGFSRSSGREGSFPQGKRCVVDAITTRRGPSSNPPEHAIESRPTLFPHDFDSTDTITPLKYVVIEKKLST